MEIHLNIASEQFVEALEFVKGKVIEWSMEMYRLKDMLLKETKEAIKSIFGDNANGIFGNGELLRVKKLEARKKKLLLDWEADWRMKSRDTWLDLGDGNNNFS
jgi:hypothetical protein